MSGQNLILETREFEKSHSLPKVPIIVLTAESSAGEKLACLSQYGANEYLLKPIKLHDLMNAVYRLLVTDKSTFAKDRPKRILFSNGPPY